MKKRLFSSGLFCLLVYSGVVFSYHPDTHEKMSEAVAETSALKNDSKVLENLELEPWDKEQTFQIALRTPRTIIRLIQDGANFEDSGIRSQYHFFDPTRGTGLFGTTIPSPDWALEDKGDIGDQDFSLKDTYARLYKALTLPDKDERMHNFGLVFEGLGRVIHHLQDMAQPQHVRNDAHCDILPCRLVGKYNPSLYETHTNLVKENSEFTSLFETYPQVNFDQGRKFWTGGIKGNGKGIADFTNTNFLSAGTNFALDANGQPAVNARYGLPERNGTTDEVTLWKLLQEEGINCAPTPPPSPPPSPPPPPPPGNGGFPPVSLRGISNPTFAISAIAPALVPALAQTAAMAASTVPPACELNGTIVFYGTTVTDNYLGKPPVNNPRASTLSLFDQDLDAYDKKAEYRLENGQVIAVKKVFTLNRFNFKAAYPHLIPKAVAYSAGLVDYFFRGRLEAEDVTFTDTGITLRVKNGIDIKKYPQWDKEVLYESGSTLVISYGYKLNGQERVGVSKTVPFSDRLAPGQTSQSIYSFAVSLPINATDVKYRLVFRGKLGAENNAVAVGPIKPMAGFAFYPSYTPDDGIGGSRMVYKTSGRWRLSTEPGQARNIDWKGWYVNGKPTKVLSWRGPQARSFANPWWSRRPDPFETGIFQNGELWAVAPSPVLGAALTKDSAGREWIIAICKQGRSDVVYRRPNTKSDSNASYDPATAPGGWEQLASFPPDSRLTSEADVPWFFNGSGTEAQTMRKGDKDLVGFWLYRLRISLTVDVTRAERTNEDNLGIAAIDEVSKSCGDNGSFTYNKFSNVSGQSYVAVDYQDDIPVFATYSVSSKTRFVFYRQISSAVSSTQGQSLDGVFSETIGVPGAPDLIISSGRITRNVRDLTFANIEDDVTRGSFHY